MFPVSGLPPKIDAVLPILPVDIGQCRNQKDGLEKDQPMTCTRRSRKTGYMATNRCKSPIANLLCVFARGLHSGYRGLHVARRPEHWN